MFIYNYPSRNAEYALERARAKMKPSEEITRRRRVLVSLYPNNFNYRHFEMAGEARPGQAMMLSNKTALGNCYK